MSRGLLYGAVALLMPAALVACGSGREGSEVRAAPGPTASAVGLAVTWSVEESSGCGSVTQAGRYTAPSSATTCHVVVTSKADPTKSAIGTVSVGSGGGACGAGCLTYQSNVTLGSDPGNTATCDLLSWVDKDGSRRRVYLVNATPQPFYLAPTGGYIQRYEWTNAGALRQCDNAGGQVGGWGFTVNHGNFPHRAWMDSKEDGYDNSSRFVQIGDHHAIWEFKTQLGTSGIGTTPTVPVTQHYVFKDGDDQFQYAITFDTTGIASPTTVPGLLGADSRTPYGSINWDGLNGVVARRSGFRLGADNIIAGDLSAMTWQNQTYGAGYDLAPFVEVWNTQLLGGIQYDDEMGYVQTRLQRNHRAGNGQGTANGAASGVIQSTDVSLFDYQLMEYQGWYNERTCWQADGPMGTRQLGVSSGFEDYSLSVLIDKRSERGVQRLIDEANAIQDVGTSLSASTGHVATAGFEGPGMSIARRWDKPGFDQVYRNWVLVAAGNAAAATLTVASGKSLRNPTFVVSNYTAATKPSVRRNGAALVEGTDYNLSLSPSLQQVWVTFLSACSGATAVAFDGPADTTGVSVTSFAASPASVTEGAATTVLFSAQIAGATGATLDLSALGGGASVAMAASGSTFTASYQVPASVKGGGLVLVPLRAIGAGGTQTALTGLLVQRADQPIYTGSTDHVVAGWEPNGHVSKVTTGSPYEGTTQLQVSYNGTGVVADVAFDRSYDLTPYKFLGIAIRGPTGSGQRLSFELRSAGNFGSGMRSYGQLGAYTKLYVPMVSFPVDLTQVQGIRLQIDGASGAGTVYLDDISFTAVAGAPSASEVFTGGYLGAIR